MILKKQSADDKKSMKNFPEGKALPNKIIPNKGFHLLHSDAL